MIGKFEIENCEFLWRRRRLKAEIYHTEQKKPFSQCRPGGDHAWASPKRQPSPDPVSFVGNAPLKHHLAFGEQAECIPMLTNLD